MNDYDKSLLDSGDLREFIWGRCEADDDKTDEIMDAIKMLVDKDRERVLEKLGADYIQQALARGYCTKRNEKKIFDADLVMDMALEVYDLIKEALDDKHE